MASFIPQMKPQQMRITAEHETFKKIRQLNSGFQSINWLCERKRDHKLLVRKTCHRYTYRKGNGLPTEVEILFYAIPRHPRILPLENWELRSDNRLDLYYPYCEGGDLSQFASRHGRGQPEAFVWHVFISVADALAFIHYGYDRRRADPYTSPPHWQRVVHRDVKPNNIFLRTKYQPGSPFPRLVLADFGIATLLPVTNDTLGPPGWMTPEWPHATAKSDVWNLGATVHELCHGKNLTDPAPEGVDEGRWNKSPESKNPRSLPERYSDELNGDMMDCLRMDPKERVNSRDLVRHLVRDKAVVLR